MWWFWLIASGIFFVIEIFTVGFLIFWLGIAALITMVVSFFTANIGIQTLVFVITSAILMFFTRPLVNKLLKIDKSDTLPTNVYRIIGREGIVVEDINSLLYKGKVKVSGEFWSAISDSNIPKGTRIKVLEVNGVKLKVEKIKETSEVN